jgi:toxin-antitoxin system PIN domain toxin
MTTLPDVNVLVALMHKRHVHYAAAWAWVERQQNTDSICICRVVQMGVLRIATQQKILSQFAIHAEQFWTAWDEMLLDTRFEMVHEASALEPIWRNLTVSLPVGVKLDTDTYLAAFAIAGGYTLVTFDRGFQKYPGLKTEILS